MGTSPVSAESAKRNQWLDAIDASWQKQMQVLGIDPKLITSDPAVRLRYLEEIVIFRKQQKYAETLAGYQGKIDAAQQSIEAIQINSFPDDEARQLVQLYKNVRAYRTIRPRRPDLEVKYGWDELSIEDPRFSDIHDVFDIGPMLESIVDPRVVLKAGERSYAINTTDRVTNNHDAAWGISGSGSYGFFIKGDFGVTSGSNFRSTLKRIRNVSIHFDHIAALDVSRGGWFSADIFKYKRVKEYLKRDPLLAQKLNLLTTSLVIGAGLSVTLHFQDSSDVHEWGTTSGSSGGGFVIFGMAFGDSKSGSSNWDKSEFNEVDKTVTFKDGPTVCRLLGTKVTPVIADVVPENMAIGSRLLWKIPLLVDAANEPREEVLVLHSEELLERKLGASSLQNIMAAIDLTPQDKGLR